MKELICIVCPTGCHLQVDESNNYAVTGNSCSRGEQYGKTELQNPTRVITSSVRIAGALHRQCPVKTDLAIPKQIVFDAMKTLDGILLQAPVKAGQVIVPHICGTDANFIAERDC